MDQVKLFLSTYGLAIDSLGFQVLAALLLLLLVCLFVLFISRRKLFKKIDSLETNILAVLDERDLLLNDKNEKHKRYEILHNENETLYLAKETNEKNIKHLEEMLMSSNSQNEQLKFEIAKLKESAENDLIASKIIIKKREEDMSKLSNNFLTLQEQLRRDTKENIAFGDEIKAQKETITKLSIENDNLAVSLNKLKTQILIYEDEAKIANKRKLEDEKRKQHQIKIDEIKNQIYKCFQSIDHPIFACYQSDETRGTYLHVNQVSQLSYHAAKAIGCNPFYAKASALFHDLGKTSIYKYFKENWPHNKTQKLENENISYTYTHRGHMICSHVEKGVQIFQKLLERTYPDIDDKLSSYHLSEQEKAFVFEEAKEELQKSILEHQAKAQVRLLYNEAIKNGEICQAADFEYLLGQIPSDREQGIICLADSCEAAFSSNIHDSEDAVANLVTNVITGRVNSGHMNNSQLSTHDIQVIRKTFTEYLIEVWKSKRPDRMEEKVSEDLEGYNLHDSGNDIVRKMTQRFQQGDVKQKKQVLRYFIDLKNKTLNAVNIEELICLIENYLENSKDDNVLVTNILVVLSTYYRHLATLTIEDINKHHPIKFRLNKDTVDLELVQNSDISAYIEAKPVLKNNLTRMQKIRENITAGIRNHSLFESPDIYVNKWATQIDNYLSNQSNIPEVLSKVENLESANHLQNVVTTPEDFSHFISVKQEKIYISVNLDIFRCDCKFIRFIVYFYDYQKKPIQDIGGMFCTKDTKQVAILQPFLIKNPKYHTIKESAIVLPQSELHLPRNYYKSVFGRIQIHGIKADDQPFLMFDQEEEFSLDSANRMRIEN